MSRSRPGLPVHHQLLELAQTYIHAISDAIQPSHPLSSPSPPAFNLSHNQGLFQWVSSSHQVAKVLEFQLQHQSFQWIFRTDFIQDWLLWYPCSPRDSQESSPTPQFKSINSSALSSAFNAQCSAFRVQLSHPYKTTGNDNTFINFLCFYLGTHNWHKHDGWWSWDWLLSELRASRWGVGKDVPSTLLESFSANKWFPSNNFHLVIFSMVKNVY